MLWVPIWIVDAIQMCTHNIPFYKENQEKKTQNIA